MLVLLFVIWSNAFTAIKHLREIFTPNELILARFLPFMVFSMIYLSFNKERRKESAWLIRNSALKIILMGIAGIAGYNFFLYVAQAEIKPGAAALITTLSPLFTLFLALIFLKERAGLKTVAGIVIAFAGLYIVVNHGKIGMGTVKGVVRADIRYALIAALAPLCWSIYTIIGKSLAGNRSAFTITSISAVAGTIPFLPLFNGSFLAKVASMGPSHWISLAHLTLLCTIAGFWIWNFALRRLPATSVSSFIYLNPPFAALSGYFFFGEEITGFFIIGSIILLAGLYLSQSEVRFKKNIAGASGTTDDKTRGKSLPA